jgi:hypothetical protein
MERFYFGHVSLMSWRVPVPEWTTLSQDLGNVQQNVILLRMLCISLVCSSPPFFDARDLHGLF